MTTVPDRRQISLDLPSEVKEKEVALVRVAVGALAEGTLQLDEKSSRYLCKVHRLRAGAEIELFSPIEGLVAKGKLLSDRLPHVEVSVETVVEEGGVGVHATERLELTRGVARLLDHRFVCNKIGRDGSAKANVEASRGDEVFVGRVVLLHLGPWDFHRYLTGALTL